MKKPRLLLHICCAPCSTHVLKTIGRDFDVMGYFYNPNIQPESEYERRLAEAERYCLAEGTGVYPSEYRPEDWARRIRGYENEPEGGKRCEICFRIRLNATARLAAHLGFDLFCTTLTISPHKDSSLINRIGAGAAEESGVNFLQTDFKGSGGYEKSCRLSRDFGLYRQNYCGCIFSARAGPAPR